MLNLEEGSAGNVFLIMMRAVGSNVFCIHDLQPFLLWNKEEDCRFYNFRGLIVEIVGWVNGYQERELIQINRYDNDYEY
jgi:hypothetical protein